jgi:hypothetical protein
VVEERKLMTWARWGMALYVLWYYELWNGSVGDGQREATSAGAGPSVADF